jgi:hypothetical protein
MSAMAATGGGVTSAAPVGQRGALAQLAGGAGRV